MHESALEREDSRNVRVTGETGAPVDEREDLSSER
jgi:hypothetical protein